jgi:hypothetical protein
MPDPDHLIEMLRSLQLSDMSPQAARRLRDAACRSLIRRRGRAVPLPDTLTGLYGRVLEPALAAGLSLGFLAWTIGRAVEVLRSATGNLF